ncbi:MAG: calcium-binding protein [Sulfitobacter sp.]
MLMLLALAVPVAVLGFAIDSASDDDDDNSVEEIGTEGADSLEGGTDDDFIDGQAGDDVLHGRAGNDTIFGREGDDVLQGEDGDDMLCAGDGDDFVTGNTGQDFIEGQGGDDFVSGDYGWDTVLGNEGNDTVLGGRGGDVIQGNEGDDVVFGGIINGLPLSLDELTELRDGESLAEINDGIEMRDDSLGNTLRGGTDEDDLIIGSGDWAHGGLGADTFHVMSEQNMGGIPNIADYRSNEDAITVIVDDVNADADITVTTDGEDALIQMGDMVLARVTGAAESLEAEDVSLISENAVEAMFEPNSAAA